MTESEVDGRLKDICYVFIHAKFSNMLIISNIIHLMVTVVRSSSRDLNGLNSRSHSPTFLFYYICYIVKCL